MATKATSEIGSMVKMLWSDGCGYAIMDSVKNHNKKDAKQN